MRIGNNSLTFLGTAGSMGIPVIGCHCSVCLSTNTQNQRLRAGALLSINGKQLLIDAGPDLRQQLLSCSNPIVDGVIITHAHNDHTAGLDDLRVISMWKKAPVPVLLLSSTAKDIKKRFAYIFQAPTMHKLVPRLAITELVEELGTSFFVDVPIHYTTYEQAGMQVMGIRVGDMAYITDIKGFREDIFSFLKGVHTLVVSALRFTSSHLHFTVDEAIDFSRRVQAKKTYLTHIAHELDHEKTNQYLPEGIELAFDGLTIAI